MDSMSLPGSDDQHELPEPVSNMSITSSSAPKPPCNRKESEVWNLFEKIVVNEGGKMVPKAKCSMCAALLNRGGNHGTNSLLRHMKMHAARQSKTSDLKSQMMLGKDQLGNVSNFKFDKKRARQEVVDFIIRAELPFAFVDQYDFNGMIQRGFAPQYSGFSSQTCKRDVMKMFDSKKSDLVKFLHTFDGSVCVTSDMWTSRQKMGYMSLTVHFIDKSWLMHKRILSFKMVEYPHTGEILAGQMFDELIAWQLHKKLLTVSLDNASSNDVLVHILAENLMLDSVRKQLLHVRCTCHILNLIVQDGLAILSPSIEKITTLIRSMNSSVSRHEIYVNACIELGLKKKNINIDVPHRWNSTFDLLKCALEYRSALHRYAQKMNEKRNVNLDVPSNDDWYIALLLCNFLSVFNLCTKMCSGVYKPTSHKVINCLVDLYVAFEKYKELPIFRTALLKMKTKFDKYWSSFPIVFCLATVCDPRYKMCAFNQLHEMFGVDEIEASSRIEYIRSTLHALYDTYKRKVNLASSSSESASVSADLSVSASDISTAASCLPSIPGFDVPELHNFSARSWKRIRTSSANTSSDLQMYLDLGTIECEDDDNFDILGWWKANASSYPVLSLMARDLLSVSASTVASEAAFSAGGRIVSDRRASLSPNTIEALVCLKDWTLADSRMQEAALRDEIDEELVAALASRPEWLVEDESVGSADIDSGDEAECQNVSAANVS